MNNDNGLGCLGSGIVILFLLFFLAGNSALFSGDIEDMESAVVVAVIIDTVIGIGLFCVIARAVGSSYEKRYKKNLAERKEIVVNEIGNKISQRKEIQQTFDKHFEKIERQFSLVSLISSCMGNNNQELKNLLVSNKEEAFASTKNEIFVKLSEDEKKRFPENVYEVVDYRKTLKQEISEMKTDLSSVAEADDKQLSIIIKKHCPGLYKSIKHNRKKLFAAIVIPITMIVTLVFSFNFINNKPYRELHSMIEEQSLTVETFDWDNREKEGSYYDYLHSEKGYRFLAAELTKLHRNNDIKKAMWLLCIQPDCIDGITVCASDSFIDWVVNYSRENGSKKTDYQGNTIYSVDGYEIAISSIFDYSEGHYFRISDGQNKVSVERKITYYEGNVPTIQ